MPKVKTTYAYKIQSIVKEFPHELMESDNNQLYCNLCKVRFLPTNAFLLILIEIHRNIKKCWVADTKILFPDFANVFSRLRKAVTPILLKR